MSNRKCKPKYKVEIEITNNCPEHFKFLESFLGLVTGFYFIWVILKSFAKIIGLDVSDNRSIVIYLNKGALFGSKQKIYEEKVPPYINDIILRNKICTINKLKEQDDFDTLLQDFICGSKRICDL